jgi:hypothetical protein
VVTLSRAIPPTNGTQPADSPAVTWWDGRAWCSTCSTSLTEGSTVGPDHKPVMRPVRVPVCPVCPEVGP